MSNILFGLNIAQIVNSSIQQAGGVLDGTLIKITTGTRTPGNLAGGTNPTSASHAFKGFVDNRSEVRREGSIVSDGGQIISILGDSLPAGIIPEQGDQITISGESETFTITGIPARDPAKALYECAVDSSS